MILLSNNLAPMIQIMGVVKKSLTFCPLLASFALSLCPHSWLFAYIAPTYANQVGHGGEKNASGSPVRRGKKDNRRDRGTTVRYIQ